MDKVKAFISYSRADSEVVKRFYEQLNKFNIVSDALKQDPTKCESFSVQINEQI